MIYNTSIDEIIDNLSKKYTELSKKEIQDIIFHNFSEVKKSISREDFPKVLLHNLGSFEVNIKYLRKRIHLLNDLFSRREKLTKNHFDRYFQYISILERLEKEGRTKLGIEDLLIKRDEVLKLYKDKFPNEK